MRSSVAFILFVGLIILASCTNNSYELVWADEFNYEGLPDATRWNYDTKGNAYRWGNQELQYYTSAKKENAFVSNGKLNITAHKDSVNEFGYTSARLTTKGKGDWLYGKIEVMAKVPGGLGLWPAIWMLPTKSTYGGWPNSGEIDIMEHVGYEPDSAYFTVHTQAYNHSIGTHKSGALAKPGLEEQFHLYWIEWTPEKIDFYMDDTLAFTYVKEANESAVWPYNIPFHLILNVAVGGTWGGAKGLDNSIFPKTMEVEYVRVYQKK